MNAVLPGQIELDAVLDRSNGTIMGDYEYARSTDSKDGNKNSPFFAAEVSFPKGQLRRSARQIPPLHATFAIEHPR